MIKFIDKYKIKNKQILLKVDFNVALNSDFTISDDSKIKQTLPTLKYLLKDNNRLIIVSHLNHRPKRCKEYSLAKVVTRLQTYFPKHNISLVDNFLSCDKNIFKNQTAKDILVLENIRFYLEEMQNNAEFAQKLANLGEVFVSDAFAVSHRAHASTVGVPNLLPSYGGLLMKKEVTMLTKGIHNPKKPVVAIIGGVKISTKINLLEKLINITDDIIVGGALANTFLASKGYKMGKSFHEKEYVEKAQELLSLAVYNNVTIHLPQDVSIGEMNNTKDKAIAKNADNIAKDEQVLDIGPKTRKQFGQVIANAKTIIWNGPVGYTENPQFKKGTNALYAAIVKNKKATSLLGGGDTLAVISSKKDLNQITHISTGGGAMLEFIEQGTLPGIEALR